jgi:ArsR family transcriptional regulator
MNIKHKISDVAQMYKALGDETRLRILGLLRLGELCVCDIMETLGLPQSTASRHLAYLKNSDWITGTRRGKWMYYQLHHSIAETALQEKILASLEDLPQCDADLYELKHYLKRKNAQECQ